MRGLIGFFTAVVIAFEGLSLTVCTADRGESVSALMTGAENRVLNVYELDDTRTEEADGELFSIMAENDPDTSGSETPMPFYEYSNEYYASLYGYGYGHGYAYLDIYTNARDYGNYKLWMYDELLSVCREFSTDYTDVMPYAMQMGNGRVSNDMNRIGSRNIMINFDKSVIDLQTSKGQKDAENLIYETYFTFRNDHPEYYWLSSTATVFFSVSQNTIIFVPQSFEEFIAGKTRKAIDERMQESIDWFLDGVYQSAYYGSNRNTYYICAVLRKMLLEATDYGWQDAEQTIPLDNGTAHSIVSMLDADRSTLAVCEGYAKSFQLLLNKLGIDNIYVTGEAGSQKESHAWNIVRMPDNTFYNFDITWEENYPFRYFAAGSDRFSEGDDIHTPYSSDSAGAEYLYALPAIPFNDYPNPGGESIVMIGCPTPRPDMPLETFTPEPLDYYGSFEDAEAIRIRSLAWDKYDSRNFRSYGDLFTWNITVKKNMSEENPEGEDAVYGTDFAAFYDGNLLNEARYEYTYITVPVHTETSRVAGYYNEQEITADDIKNKLIIVANPGVTIKVMPQYYNTAGTQLYKPVESLSRSRTVGEDIPQYARFSLKDYVRYKGNSALDQWYADFIGVVISVYDETGKDITSSGYGKVYKAEYKGSELIYSDYHNALTSVTLQRVYDDGKTTVMDIMNGMNIRLRPGIKMEITPLYTVYDDLETKTLRRDDAGGIGYFPLENGSVEISFEEYQEETTKEPIPTLKPTPTPSPTPSPTPTPTPTPTPVIATPEPASEIEGSFIDLTCTGAVTAFPGAFDAISSIEREKVINHSEARKAADSGSMSVYDDKAKGRSVYAAYDVLVNAGDTLSLSAYNETSLGPRFDLEGNSDGTASASYVTDRGRVRLNADLLCGTWYRVLIEMPIERLTSDESRLTLSTYTIYRIDPAAPAEVSEIAAQAKGIQARNLYNKAVKTLNVSAAGSPYIDNGAAFIANGGYDMLIGFVTPSPTPEPTPTPTPTPTPEPTAVPTPAPWVGSVKIADLYTDHVGPRYSEYSSSEYLQINVKKNNADAVYGRDYIAVKDGVKVESFSSGIKVGMKTIYSDMEIHAVKGVEVSVTAIIKDASGGLHTLPEATGRTVTIGETVRYTDEYIRDSVDYNGDYSRYGIEAYRPYFTIALADGSEAEYNTDYICEYGGRYLFENEYLDIMSGHIEAVLGEGTTGKDVFEKLVIRAVNDITVTHLTYVKLTSSGQTGVLPESNRKQLTGLYPTVKLDAPLCVDLTLQHIGDNIYVNADRDIPDSCDMYIAVYNEDGTLRSVKMVKDRLYIHNVSEDEAELKAFAFDDRQYPASDVQVIDLR